MDLALINDMIDEIEESETSLSNIRNLSALYTVKNHLVGGKVYNNVVKELNDILPSYLEYIEVKRKYQMKETTDASVVSYLYNVCNEIKEFIQTLYSGTDTEKERELIKDLVEHLKEIL